MLLLGGPLFGASMHVDLRTVLRFAGERNEEVDVARDERGLGHDADRMLETGQHLQHGARDLPLPLDRLIGIGIGPQRDRCDAVASCE